MNVDDIDPIIKAKLNRWINSKSDKELVKLWNNLCDDRVEQGIKEAKNDYIYSMTEEGLNLCSKHYGIECLVKAFARVSEHRMDQCTFFKLKSGSVKFFVEFCPEDKDKMVLALFEDKKRLEDYGILIGMEDVGDLAYMIEHDLTNAELINLWNWYSGVYGINDYVYANTIEGHTECMKRYSATGWVYIVRQIDCFVNDLDRSAYFNVEGRPCDATFGCTFDELISESSPITKDSIETMAERLAHSCTEEEISSILKGDFLDELDNIKEINTKKENRHG